MLSASLHSALFFVPIRMSLLLCSYLEQLVLAHGDSRIAAQNKNCTVICKQEFGLTDSVVHSPS
jgi:hypothetical protein